jgi:hypothetical protein
MNTPRIFALSFALAASAFLASPTPTHAQARTGHGPGRVVRPPFRNSGGRGRFARPLRSSEGYALYPLFYDYGYDSDYGAQQPVQVVYEQPPQPAVEPAPKPKPAESLILEEHDGHWVRVLTGNQLPIEGQPSAKEYAPVPSHPGYMEDKNSPSQAELPPVVLIFRDGHQETVDKYVIHGNALFTGSDYWTTGSWTKQIPLAQLDIPASVQLNAQRGSKFNLPKGPNEVAVHF